MPYKKNLWISKALLLLDYLILNACFILTYLNSDHFDKRYIAFQFILFAVYINFAWLIISRITGLYTQAKLNSRKSLAVATFLSIIIFFFFFIVYFQILSFNYLDRDVLKQLFIVFSLVIFGYKFTFFSVVPLINRKISKGRRILIVGYSKDSKTLLRSLLQNSWQSNEFLGYFSDNNDQDEHYLGSYQELGKYVESNQVDDVYLALKEIPADMQYAIFKHISNQPVNVFVLPELSMLRQGSFSLGSVGDVPVLSFERGPLNKPRNLVLKRIFDIVLSIIAIVLVLSWLIPIILLANFILYGHSVFFIQKRNGLNNKTFECVKFKTMHTNKEANLQGCAVNDPRITPLGKFLRKTSLDEFPQFFNVLLGQMSVVGPRPHMLLHTDEYRKVDKKFMVRHTVKPGLTGLAQIQGCRGSIENFKHLRRRVQLDIAYIERWSLWLDMKILILTAFSLFRSQTNAY